MLKLGLYEQVISHWIQDSLSKLSPNDFYIDKIRIHEAESISTLAQYMAKAIQEALASTHGDNALQGRIQLCNDIIGLLVSKTDSSHLEDFLIHPDAELLLALLDKQNSAIGVSSRAQSSTVRPATSIARSSLFTGAAHEPSMVGELKKEILTSNRIDMLVSFIKWSGLRLILEELGEFTKSGQLRIITTSYMGATDIKAIDALRELPNTQIRVSYDTMRTRLHAKAYVFHRETGFSTAYIGSSNLSSAALSNGLEWNIKVTAKDQSETLDKVTATFESYWYDYEFVPYEEQQRPVLVRALQAERYHSNNESGFVFDITPYAFQKEILDRLDAERKIRGYYRNLIVAATGTGKTVISAFDYKRYRDEHPGRPNRLLFVAHREEILKQSLDCFRVILRDMNFGELFVGEYEPTSLEHLFISVQTFNSRDLMSVTSPDFYDFIIVDEFHHAAAPTYQRLLTHAQPEVLLGLTATPERMDGKSVLDYFNGRIATEIRLPEAIDRGLLSPFQYFGVTDSVDLSTLHWRRGGYDLAELSNVYTGNRQRADLVVRSLIRYVTDMDKVVGLGFCVSVDHARFMADFMNHHGIPSLALHAKSPDAERADAKRRLTSGELRFIFVVDLYNEGVDIPEVNTVLFLRPTESLTVFLQQLGRGLRTFEGKECLTVLDFIGQSHKKYRFEDKFAALLNSSRKSIQHEVKEGFLNVPRGCFIQLEKQAMQYVLDNVQSAVNSRLALIDKIQSFSLDTGLQLTLENFVDYYHMSLRDLYRGQSPASFARLSAHAGLRERFTDPDETVLTKALQRVCSINSRRWIQVMLQYLQDGVDVKNALGPVDSHMLLMFHYTIWQRPLGDVGFASVGDSIARIRRNPTLTGEIIEILRYNLNHLDFVDEPINLGFDNPLDLHCTYTRDQVLAALDFYTEEKMPAMREGVKYLPDKKLDVFFITLNKSDKDYSPTTMYQDYAINDVLFHWQSQSTTPEDSPTGQRYVHHKEMGHRIVLFVREFKGNSAGTLPYTYLGTAEYVGHTSSRPMNITWRLDRPIPAGMMRKTNKLIVV